MRAFDESYLQALAQRDPRTEEDFISVFSRPIKCKLRTHLRSPQAVEDACQETLLRVFAYFRVGKTLRNPASLPAFVQAVSTNVALEMLRASRCTTCSCQDVPEIEDVRSNPERDALARERGDTVRRVLAELSNMDQELLRRVCLEDEDRDQICRELRVTRDYLRLLLHRARLRFKAQLSGLPLEYRSSGSRNSGGDAHRGTLPLRRAYAG